MKDYEDYQRVTRVLDFEEIQNVRGGINWPFFDLLSIMQNICVGEDVSLYDVIQFKN